MTDYEFYRVVVPLALALFAGWWGISKLIVGQFRKELDLRFEQLSEAGRSGGQLSEQKHKNMQAQLDHAERRLVEMAQQFQKQQIEVLSAQAAASEKFVTQADFTRALLRMETKHDELLRGLSQIKDRLYEQR